MKVFATQGHTRQEWQDIVTEMSNAGAEASDAEFKQIVAYLAKHFPKDRKAPQKRSLLPGLVGQRAAGPAIR